MSDHYWYLWFARRKGVADLKKKSSTLTLYQVYQLPSSKVPLYVELLAGKMLFRAPIAEDFWGYHFEYNACMLFQCKFQIKLNVIFTF